MTNPSSSETNDADEPAHGREIRPSRAASHMSDAAD